MMGHIDNPKIDERFRKPDFICNGWAYSEEGILVIKILIDEREVGEAEYGLPRNDVKAAFPQYSDIEKCGFNFIHNAPLSKGHHKLTVRAYEKTGKKTDIGSVTLTLEKSSNLFARLSSVFSRKLQITPAIFDSTDPRKRISIRYIKGSGVEIGALHNPLSISNQVHIKYVDRAPLSELKKHYPELHSCQMVDIDIIDDGETLSTLADCSQDFIIANHFLEHCENPIGTIQNHLKKVRPGGLLYYAIPEKTQIFDKERHLTTFEHLVNDFFDTAASRKEHFYEWVTLVEQNKGDITDINSRISALMAMNYSIHYHVWDTETIFQFWFKTNEYLNNPFIVLHFERNENEIITILQKRQI